MSQTTESTFEVQIRDLYGFESKTSEQACTDRVGLLRPVIGSYGVKERSTRGGTPEKVHTIKSEGVSCHPSQRFPFTVFSFSWSVFGMPENTVSETSIRRNKDGVRCPTSISVSEWIQLFLPLIWSRELLFTVLRPFRVSFVTTPVKVNYVRRQPPVDRFCLNVICSDEHFTPRLGMTSDIKVHDDVGRLTNGLFHGVTDVFSVNVVDKLKVLIQYEHKHQQKDSFIRLLVFSIINKHKYSRSVTPFMVGKLGINTLRIYEKTTSEKSVPSTPHPSNALTEFQCPKHHRRRRRPRPVETASVRV